MSQHDPRLDSTPHPHRSTTDLVWQLAGDPTRLHEWFPGSGSCHVDGNVRVIVLDSGLSMPEEILVNDDILHRFQYRITSPPFTYHRGMIDIIDLADKHASWCIRPRPTRAQWR